MERGAIRPGEEQFLPLGLSPFSLSACRIRNILQGKIEDAHLPPRLIASCETATAVISRHRALGISKFDSAGPP